LIVLALVACMNTEPTCEREFGIFRPPVTMDGCNEQADEVAGLWTEKHPGWHVESVKCVVKSEESGA
jgi:hypothetical protein